MPGSPYLRKLASMLAILVALVAVTARAEVIHEERSLYRDITIEQNGPRRCLIFNVHRGDRNQTCVDVEDRMRLVFTYTRMSLAGLLLNPEPRNILIAGLGGGTIPMTLSDRFPNANMDIVEIDQAVVNVARDFFFYEETANMSTHVEDARVFIKRAGLRGMKYDFIMLDAFTGDYIPEHLLTREFLEEVKSLLTPDGVLVANTFSTSRFYDHESVTYQRVFGEFFNFKMPNSGNRIIITQLQPLPPRGQMVDRAELLAPTLEKYGVPLMDYPARLSTRVDWDMSRRVLTDQYSPGNLLRGDL